MAITDFEAEAWGTATDLLTGEPTIREQLLDLAERWEASNTAEENTCGQELHELLDEILPE